MTSRFQEITRNLDLQVRERSRQLVRSERLAGIGFLAAGVAHEINNPLSAIAMASESLEGRIPKAADDAEKSDAEVCHQYLQMIQRESFRCQQITARLLNFARGETAVRSPTELASLISEVLAMVQHMSKFRDRHIVFEPSRACYAEINGPEIKQVALNIVANALESMEPGGTLRIDLIEETDQVILSFADDGCGMTPTVIDNLFEPFFTQRKDGKGTGLGMSISHRIVSDHGGTIEVTSAGPGLGTTFRVHLPRQAAKAQTAA
jgi:signal transduction histidine kinase